MNKEQITEFLNRLEGPEGCNFRQTDPKDLNTLRWTCASGNDKSLSRKILKAMKIKKADADIFLAMCDAMGGHCDCEILFNAEERLVDQGFVITE